MAAKGEIVMLMFYDEAVCLTEVCRLCMNVYIWPFALIIGDIRTWIVKSPGAFMNRYCMAGYMHVNEM